MFIINPRTKREMFLRLDGKFRDNYQSIPSAGTYKNSLLFLSTFEDNYWNYRIVTEPLSPGTWIFKLVTEDDLQNYSGGSQGNVVIGSWILPPDELEITASGSDVTLEWEHSSQGAPDNYVIYSNNGSGQVNRTVPYDTIAGSLTTYSANGLGAGTWLFVVEAKTTSPALESVSYYTLVAELPTTSKYPEIPGGSDIEDGMVMLYNVSTGKIGGKFIWLFGDEATHFRLYTDKGTGTMVYGYTYYRFARQSGIVQEFLTPQLYFGAENQEFKVVIRAENQTTGMIETNEIEHTVLLDGVAPSDVDSLSITA